MILARLRVAKLANKIVSTLNLNLNLCLFGVSVFKTKTSGIAKRAEVPKSLRHDIWL